MSAHQTRRPRRFHTLCFVLALIVGLATYDGSHCRQEERIMGSKSAPSVHQRLWPAALMLAVFALLTFYGEAFSAQQSHEGASSGEGAVTFTRDVAPILQENCQI